MKGKISKCEICKKETTQLFYQNKAKEIVCSDCYDANKNNPPRKDDSYFKEHLVKRR